jgi:hypothetical protein
MPAKAVDARERIQKPSTAPRSLEHTEPRNHNNKDPS